MSCWPCRVCGEERRGGAHGRCRRCYQYWLRHGRAGDRPLDLGAPRPCVACGVGLDTLHYSYRSRILRRGRCPRCYMRWWVAQRTGVPA